jgi:hypothetical protein
LALKKNGLFSSRTHFGIALRGLEVILTEAIPNMPISAHDAEQRILDAIARKAVAETILIPVDKPDVPIWGVDPNK